MSLVNGSRRAPVEPHDGQGGTVGAGLAIALFLDSKIGTGVDYRAQPRSSARIHCTSDAWGPGWKQNEQSGRGVFTTGAFDAAARTRTGRAAFGVSKSS